MAAAVAKRSSCIRSQVGAVIVHDNFWTYVGYNGPSRGKVNCDDGGCPRGRKSFEELPSGSGFDGYVGFCTAVHAEINALSKFLGHRPVNGRTILYTTREPCAGCWHKLLAAGFTTDQIVWG